MLEFMFTSALLKRGLPPPSEIDFFKGTPFEGSLLGHLVLLQGGMLFDEKWKKQDACLGKIGNPERERFG